MNKQNQAIDGEAKAKPEVMKLGLDLYARQVTECRQLDGSIPKPAGTVSIVAAPTPEQEQQRSVVRYRGQLLRDRRRARAQLASASYFSHLKFPPGSGNSRPSTFSLLAT
jgi:hypothetical protein